MKRFPKGPIQALVRGFTEAADPNDLDAVDPGMLLTLLPIFDFLARRWYRMRVEGLDRIPSGKAIVVINHESGITFLELFALGSFWVRERYTGDHPDLFHGLGHDAIFRIPGVSNFLVRCGGLVANHRNADRVFAAGRKILVAPGGNLEAFRPWRERFKIKFGGHNGFAKVALRHRVPIVPVVFAGGHESFFVINDGRSLVERFDLHRRFRMDTFPLVVGLPWGLWMGPLFHLPLPTRCDVRILDTIDTTTFGAEDDPAAVDALYDEVTGRMQATLTDMGSKRRFPVLG
ncbi:MAG: 1-acyl-sn-glycerol-3-phosphate acyltransferase [Pseudomonadota bacterium]